MKREIIIENKIDELPILFKNIEEIGVKWKLPVSLTMNLNLVLEEAVSNVIFYAYTDDEKHEITILLSLIDNLLKIEIIDDGIAFDPTQKEQPNITLSAEERSIGGLGIFLIKQIMDTVEYSRANNKNILTLIKRI